ncbi:hypothetical protein D3C73_1354430 [compost metagenome]
MTDQINTGSRNVGAARNPETRHLGTEITVRDNQFAGNNTILHDVLLMVNVVNEQIQRRHTLDNARFKLLPFFSRYDPWNHVEGNRPLHRLNL